MTDYDVIVLGFGPSGQVAAALLGQAGHSVAVFDRWPDKYPLPRAGHIDHEVMRIFQGIGAADQFEQKAIPIPDYDWFNAAGDLLLHLDWNAPTPSGWKADYLHYQPDQEDALTAAVERQSSVVVSRGWEATAIIDHGDHVQVDLREGQRVDGTWTPTGATRTVTAGYLLGADGAGSFTRHALGFEMEDFGFQEDWLVIDVRPNVADMPIEMPDCGQICDPAGPVSLFRWLGREHCRWEFMVLPGETHEQVNTHEAVYAKLARWGVTPENSTITRRVVYTFRSLLTPDFRSGRVLLVGDSAHQMPPFMGQGACSGMRDAANIAWKLDLIVRGVSDASLLDTYTVERRPHVEQLIRMSMGLGQVVCISDPEIAAERDRAFLAHEVPPPPPFPCLVAGVLQGGVAAGVVGQLGVQGRVVRQGVTGRADDLLGVGWTLLTTKANPRALLDERQRGLLEAIAARVVHVSQATLSDPDSLVDIDATYAKWFTELQVEAILVRPDYYVFGTASTMGDIPALLDDLASRLALA